MNEQERFDYQRIAEAIEYIKANFKKQPDLESIAGNVHLSPFHFQRLFSQWAGISPKKFLQYISVEHAKKLLKENKATLLDASIETGLSGTSRLHDLFVKIEGMSPAEYKNGARDLSISYSFAESPFGNLIVASTSKGICYMAFAESETIGFQLLQQYFPNASFIQRSNSFQEDALRLFQNDWSAISTIQLHVRGTAFQLKVWEALLKIPMGQFATYGAIAQQIGSPKASRAVGTAIGSNPVAFLIPCHRVIQSTGVLGGYMWGPTRKAAIIGWEGAKTFENNNNN